MDYVDLISESVEELATLEKSQSQALGVDCLRFVRLLKSGQATSQRQAGGLIGLQERQSQRLWPLYRQQGLSGLLRYSRHLWQTLQSATLPLAHLPERRSGANPRRCPILPAR